MRPAQPVPVSPALLQHLEDRSKRREDRAADAITRFAGSMKFVYLHAAWFTAWIALGVEDYPFGLLTMIVSLEAIFLSTFVMISQNRADEKRQVIADQQWQTVQKEEQQNERLLSITHEILGLAEEIHAASASSTRRPLASACTDTPGGYRRDGDEPTYVALSHRPQPKGTHMTTHTYAVSGMTCGHCVGAVTRELKAVDGVADVQVDLVADGTSTVTVASRAPLEDARVAAALEEAGGYQLV
jgi:copper chaperone CopZ